MVISGQQTHGGIRKLTNPILYGIMGIHGLQYELRLVSIFGGGWWDHDGISTIGNGNLARIGI